MNIIKAVSDKKIYVFIIWSNIFLPIIILCENTFAKLTRLSGHMSFFVCLYKVFPHYQHAEIHQLLFNGFA